MNDTRLHECCKCRHIFSGSEVEFRPNKRGENLGRCPKCDCGTHYCINPDGCDARMGEWKPMPLDQPPVVLSRFSSKKRNRILAAYERARAAAPRITRTNHGAPIPL